MLPVVVVADVLPVAVVADALCLGVAMSVALTETHDRDTQDRDKHGRYTHDRSTHYRDTHDGQARHTRLAHTAPPCRWSPSGIHNCGARTIVFLVRYLIALLGYF